MGVPKKIAERLASTLKQMQPVITQQKKRDVSEADTVTLVKDILSDMFGYDKYSELTGEFAIRGTYCDIVIMLAGKQTVIVEVKAIGISLNDKHVKQAIDYAANQGVEWVILTNAVTWQLYGVIFGKPIDKLLLAEIDLTTINYKDEDAIECLHLLTKHGYEKGLLEETMNRARAINRHMIAAVIVHNDKILNTLRRELRRIVEVNVTTDELSELLTAEVIKRDALEGKEAVDAAKLVNSREGKRIHKKRSRSVASDGEGPTDKQENESREVGQGN